MTPHRLAVALLAAACCGPAAAAPVTILLSGGPAQSTRIVESRSTSDRVSFPGTGATPPLLPSLADAAVDAKPVKQSKSSSTSAGRDRRPFAFLKQLQRTSDDATAVWANVAHGGPATPAGDDD
jgi:hypothetical protein